MTPFQSRLFAGALCLIGFAVSGCGKSTPVALEVKSRPATETASRPSSPVAASPHKAGTTQQAASAGQPFVGLAAQEDGGSLHSSRKELIESQLAAGEFGPALDAAVATFDSVERTELLKLVAAAQRQAGDFEAARATIRLIPKTEDRISLQADRAAEEMLAGGGSLANFQPLIDLIQNETSGPWFDIDGTGGTISQFDTGVRVDPNGLLAMVSKEEHQGRLAALGVRARQADLNSDVAKSSELRLISLRRLEHEVSKRIASGQPALETMKHFAGLSRIQYVFIDHKNADVIIGGPAEAWRFNENGLPVGVDSGRPTLQLDDFATLIRTFHEGGRGIFQCLIVPREEGLKSLKEYVAQTNARGPLPAGGAVKNWVNNMQQKLGLQDVEINGVANDSRVARVIVEADYRMKLIGVDKLDGGKEIPSYFDLLPLVQPKEVPDLDGLRWWLTMKYESVLHSPDRAVFEIQGSSVLCQSENELITAQGKRIHTGKSEPTNRMFAQNFTKGYASLAERDIVFADLQNIFDLSLVSALVAQERREYDLQWTPGVFGDGGSYVGARFETPKTVMSVVNHRVYGGKDIVVQVAGGVRGDLKSVLADNSVVKESPRLANLAKHAEAPALPEGRWWWDVVR